VFSGGNLVVCLSSQWRSLWEYPLGVALPVEGVEPVILKGSRALGHFGRAHLPDTTPFEAYRSKVSGGDILVGDRDFPYIVVGPYGAGQVVLVAFDPTRAPFNGWVGRETMWRNIVEETLGLGGNRDIATSQAAKRFVEDRPDVRPFSFHWAALFLLVYVLAIGPVDYLVLKRAKRLRWTWLTFPALALLFSVAALAVVNAVKSAHLLVKTYNVIGVPCKGDFVRELTYVGIHPASHGRYDVYPLDAGAAVRDAGLYDRHAEEWPGRWGVRRPSSRRSLMGGKNFVTVQSDRITIESYPINIWSVRNFECVHFEWGAPKPIECDLAVEDGRPVGTIRNNTSLDFAGFDICTSEGIFSGRNLGRGATRRLAFSGTDSLEDRSVVLTGKHPDGLSYDWIRRSIEQGYAVVICRSNQSTEEVTIGVPVPETQGRTIIQTVVPVER